MTLELFADVDYGTPRPSLAKARSLVERIEALEEVEYDVVTVACKLAAEARALGAHSVARALVYFASPEAYEVGGPFRLEIIATHAARRWLRRQEARLLPTDGETNPALPSGATGREGVS